MSLENKRKKTSSLLEQWKKSKKTNSGSTISARPADVQAIPSNGQQRLWLLQQLYPDNPFYQYAHLYKIEGGLDIAALEKSFQMLVDRHEVLRSNFEKQGNDLVLKIKEKVNFNCQYLDLSSAQDKEKALHEFKENESQKIFDLASDLLLRVSIVKESEISFQVILSIHHIIGDRWSLQLLNEELFNYYKAIKNGEEPKVSILAIQYSDFANWQKNQKFDAKDLNYWLQQLSGELPLLNLFGDYKRPHKPSFKGGMVSKKLSPELSTKLRQLAKKSEVTMFVLLLSVFKVLLYRFTNQNDLIIASPFSNRDKSQLEKLIGFFNETIVLRSQVDGNWDFQKLVSEVKSTTLKAFEHKNIAFDELVRQLKPERHGSANPIFQSMFLYNSALPFSIPDLGIDIQEEIIDLGVSKFDLTLFANDQSSQIEFSLEFALDLFKREKAERLLNHIANIAQSIVSEQNIPLTQITLLDQETSKKILQDWNDTAITYPDYASIHEMIEEQAKLNPEQIAVVFNDKSITYKELNIQAGRIAAKLIEEGVKPNHSVGLYANRSVELMVSILGILKAGAAYLPLDPEYPSDRIEFMIQDSGTNLILSQESLLKDLNFPHTTILSIEKSIQSGIQKNGNLPKGDPDNLAYIIYTSGSTGKPKGVPIRHRNLLHSTLSRYSFYPSNPTAFLLLSSFSFDSSVVGIFWTLCSGGTLVLPPKRIEQDVIRLTDIIADYKVSHTLMLPSLYSAILNYAPIEKIHKLRNVMVAGEACPFPLIAKHYDLLPDTELYNEYGPTEASVWCIAHKILPEEKHFVPIGKAIPNTEVYILNSELQPCPIGVPGELYIGGIGLADGYLNRPDLTKEKFIAHPFKKGDRVYKTGDLARFHSDGRIEFLGRVDHQVKIRGFRVEPDEIQKRILGYDNVNEALVIVFGTDNENSKQLVAYTSGLSENQIPQLRQYLESQLPAYMVPSSIIPIDQFPKLPNGKINRKELPDPKLFMGTTAIEFIAPQSPTEIQLAKIWQDVLNLESVGLQDNFFALGGDSILSIQVVSKAREHGIHLAPNQLFQHQTVGALANSIDNNEVSVPKINQTILPNNNPDTYPLSSLQKAFLFNSEGNGIDQGLLQLEFTIKGTIDFDVFKKAWQHSVQRHDSMRAYVGYDKGHKAIQIIADETNSDWQILDWLDQSPIEQKESLEKLRLEDQQIGINLKQAPVSRMYFIRLKEDSQLLFWTSHHIFLDGWSCGIILKDALHFYYSIQDQEDLNLPLLPNFLAYLDWKEKSDRSPETKFWKQKLEGFKEPMSFPKLQDTSVSFKDEFLKLSEEESMSLSTFCQQNSISLSTLFQGLWALLIGRSFNQTDVVFGLTVSGRFADFPQIQSTSGLFMNVIPNRLQVNNTQKFDSWLVDLQKEQGDISQFESTALEDIKSIIEWPNHLELFDTLFVFGNFLKDGLQVKDLEVEHFQGGFSSTYPLTMRVNPLSQIELDWRYDTSKISPKKIEWIKDSFYRLLKFTMLENADYLVSDALNTVDDWEESNAPNNIDHQAIKNDHSIIKLKPRNKTELDLCKIWEELFNHTNISIEDNFFELGGKSAMAIQLFSAIESKMDIVLPPSILFLNPTIVALADVIQNKAPEDHKDQILVPLRSSGEKAPLFCVHGGGAHVFFYRKMTDYLSKDQPVYSFQPPGLNGEKDFPDSIETMASQYIVTLKTVQPEGPYQILGTCFSNAVVLEMAHQLQAQGENVKKLIIIDSAPVHLFGNDENESRKTFTRFFDMAKRGDFHRIRSKIKRRFQKSSNVEVAIPASESNSEKQLRTTIDMLNRLYANYHWKPFDGKILFIRSSEFHKRSDKNYHLTQWKKLAKGGVNLEVIPGHHLTLFEDPEVQGLAEKITECIGAV